MGIQHLPLERQAEGAFDGGRIQENKPIGFPQDAGGMAPFSTLFYWAHAWSDAGGLISEHPHRGFEIVSFVLAGEIEHYDNQARAWKKLNGGDVQVIRAGNGITHAERMGQGSSMFQIWFDPGLERTLYQPASYTDYRSEQFPVRDLGPGSEQTLVGDGSPFEMQAPARVRRIRSDNGLIRVPLASDMAAAVYVLNGTGPLAGVSVKSGDFLVLKEEPQLAGTLTEHADVFVVEVPLTAPYPLYIDRYGA